MTGIWSNHLLALQCHSFLTPMRRRVALALGRVFDLDMATCPLCRHGSRRLMAAITQEAVITRMLRHLKLAAVPPPIAPARARQVTFDWVA